MFCGNRSAPGQGNAKRDKQRRNENKFQFAGHAKHHFHKEVIDSGSVA